jgi:hypothetical protein
VVVTPSQHEHAQLHGGPRSAAQTAKAVFQSTAFAKASKLFNM